jgi:hypothetical protein
MPRHRVSMHRRQGTSDTAACLRAHFGCSTFSTAQAEQLGVSARRLSQAVQAGYVVRLRRALYLLTDPAVAHPTHPHRTHPEQTHRDRASTDLAVAKHRVEQLRAQGIPAAVAEETAAFAWGLPNERLIVPTLHVPRGSAVHLGTRHGVRIRERDVDDVITFRGVPLTSPLATARDLCRGLPRHQAVALLGLAQRRQAEWFLAGDDRMNASDLTQALSDAQWRAELNEAMRQMLASSPRRWPWCASADPRPETYLEAISWGRLTGWKLGDMRPQAWVHGASGRPYRVDVLIDGVAGEADGAIKYAAGDTLWKEKRRQEDIEQGGTPVVRWTFADVEHHPEQLLERWRRALNRHAA